MEKMKKVIIDTYKELLQENNNVWCYEVEFSDAVQIGWSNFGTDNEEELTVLVQKTLEEGGTLS